MVKRAEKPEIWKAVPAIDWLSVKRIVTEKERIPRPEARASGEALGKAVEDCVRLARHLVSPAIATVESVIRRSGPEGIDMSGGWSVAGRSLAKAFAGADRAVIFVVTLGDELESAATMLMDSGDALSGYLLDRTGSFAVESLAEALEREVRRRYAAIGSSASMRYSPGYCDIPIEEQFKLDRALGFPRAGVRLTENCMMQPKKSISGLIAIGPKGLYRAAGSPCKACDLKECDYKRV
jgi:hypothetical protein